MAKKSKPPKKSQQELNLLREQADVLNQQKDLILEQQRQQDLLAPILFANFGITPTFDESGKISGFRKEETDSEKGVKSTLQRQEEFLQQQQKALEDQERFASLLLPYQLEESGLTPEYDANGEITGFTQDPGFLKLRKFRDDIDKAQLERQEKALLGQLPVDPRVTRELETSERNIRHNLQRQFGHEYETSTPGIKMLGKFGETRAAVLDKLQHDEIATGEGLSIAQGLGNQVYSSNVQKILGNLQDPGYNVNSVLGETASLGTTSASLGHAINTVNAPFSGIGNLKSVAEGYTGPLSILQNERQNKFQFDQQEEQRKKQLAASIGTTSGSIIGGLLGSLAFGIGAIPGAAVGGAVGGAAGYAAG